MRSTRLPGRPLDSNSRGQGRRHQTRLRKSSILPAIPLLAVMASAHAIPITFNDFHDPVTGAGNLWFGTTASGARTWTINHAINDDGYDALTDTITSVSIALRLIDDGDAAAESVNFTFDGVNFGSVTLGNGAAMTSVIFSSPTLPTPYLFDGLLTAKLDLAGEMSGASAARSDFHFIDSTLTVTANRRTPFSQSVPEPATWALIALGLFGLNWSLRKKS